MLNDTVREWVAKAEGDYAEAKGRSSRPLRHRDGGRMKAAREKIKLCAVSDSLTNDRNDNWLAMLAAADGPIVPLAEAHGGWTTRSYFKDKFAGVAFANVPPDADVLVVLLGSNNLWEAGGGSDQAVAEALDGVERVADLALSIAPAAQVVLAAPPSVALRKNVLGEPKPQRRIDAHSPLYLRKLSDAYRALARRRGWRFVDLFPLLDEVDFVDACHPNERGNRKIAAAMAAALRDPPPLREQR